MGRRKFDYETTIKLKHNEVPAKIDMETGEIKEIKSRKSNIPKGRELWLSEEPFTKLFGKKNSVMSWLISEKVLTDMELRVLMMLILMTEYETNSLEPLNDDYAIIKISEKFNINRNKVTPLLKKFYNLGIYGKFDVKKVDVPYTKFWILNPYLCWTGRLVDSDIAQLFVGTAIHKKYIELNSKNAR